MQAVHVKCSMRKVKNVAIHISAENSTILMVIVYAKVHYNNSKMHQKSNCSEIFNAV